MITGQFRGQAFLLRATNYAEADQILTLYSRELGKLSCLARGSRSSKKRFGSSLRPFCRFDAMLRLPASQGMAFLEGIQELESYPGLLLDLDRMASGWRLLELVDSLEEHGSAHPELFDALETGISRLAEEGGADAGLYCEAALLGLNGWSPRLDACVRCRRPFPFKPLRFSMSEGGLLCGVCQSPGAWRTLELREALALKALFEGGEDPVIHARDILTQFFQHQLGKALRTEKFEKSLKGDL